MQNSGCVEIQNHSYNMHSQNGRLGIKQKKGESSEEYKEVIPTWYEKIVTGEISLATGDPSKKITISVNNEKEAQICINEGTEEEEKWDSGNVMFHKIPKQLEVAIKKSQNKYNDYIGIVQAFDEISGIYNYTFRENGFTKSIKAIEPEF